MNTTLKYVAVALAFAAAAFAFTEDAIWAGILAASAGILTAATILQRNDK